MYSTFLHLEETTEIILETYSSMNQTLEQTYFANAYSNAYNNVLSTLTYSTLNRIQTIDLFSTNSVGILDFANYRNFDVTIHEIIDTVTTPYSLIYNSNTLTGFDYREGTLFITVSTIGYTYSTNNGMLLFDVNRAGFPTTFNESLYPYIGNGDYSLQYTYTILSNSVYANCINTYPRLDVYNLHVITSTSVYFTPQSDIEYWTPTVVDYYAYIGLDVRDYPLQNYFLRGQTIDVEWSNYTFFPFTNVGTNNYNPQVNIDTYLNGSVFQSFGPFSLNISSATIQVPYISTQMVQYNLDGTDTIVDNPMVSSLIRAYIVGKPFSASETTVYIAPINFTTFKMFQTGSNYIMGNDITITYDNGTKPSFPYSQPTYSPPWPDFGYVYTGAQNLLSFPINNFTPDIGGISFEVARKPTNYCYNYMEGFAPNPDPTTFNFTSTFNVGNLVDGNPSTLFISGNYRYPDGEYYDPITETYGDPNHPKYYNYSTGISSLLGSSVAASTVFVIGTLMQYSGNVYGGYNYPQTSTFSVSTLVFKNVDASSPVGSNVAGNTIRVYGRLYLQNPPPSIYGSRIYSIFSTLVLTNDPIQTFRF
jgi:hypothetical protein